MASFCPRQRSRLLGKPAIHRLANALVSAGLQSGERGAVLAKNSLEYVLLYYGASPIAEPTLRRAIEVFRCDFIQGYGMTETTAGIALLLPADHQRGLTDKPALLRSAGRPMLGTEVRIVDAQDTPMLPGTIGEIVARGPQLMKGY